MSNVFGGVLIGRVLIGQLNDESLVSKPFVSWKTRGKNNLIF